MKIAKWLLVIALLFSPILTQAEVEDEAPISLNGYFASLYEESDKKGSVGSYDAFVFSLITSAHVGEEWTALLQVDYEHSPFIDISANSASGAKTFDGRSSGEIAVSNAYARWNFKPYLNVRMGKFFAPWGYYNELTYAAPTYPTLKLPRASVYQRSGTTWGDAQFYQRYVTGLWASGNLELGDNGNLEYNLYTGNGRTVKQHKENNGLKSIGSRTTASMELENLSFEISLSTYRDDFNTSAPSTPAWVHQNSLMPGGAIEWGNLVIRGEYAVSTVTAVSPQGGEFKSQANFIEAYYTLFGKWTPHIRHQFNDPNTNDKATLDSMEELTIGLAYHFQPWASQIKAQGRIITPESQQSYTTFGAGIALGF